MSRLHFDILLNIFDNYNDIASRSSLDNLRSASQVCRAWRKLLVESPVIWAKLVNLDFLDQKTGYWRYEVLRRTGNVPLYIQCHRRSMLQSPSLLPFFETLLADNWHRIKSLSVKLPYHYLLAGGALVTTLQEPAPLMEKLAIDVHREGSNVLQHYIDQVVGLGEHAPFIRYLEVPIFSIPLETPWFLSLRVMHFAPGEFTPGELIEILSYTPLLEQLGMTIRRILGEGISLAVGEEEEEAEREQGLDQTIDLPFLNSIDIRTESFDWTRYLDVLGCIRASVTHSLTFNSKNLNVLPTTSAISKFSALLEQQRIFDTEEDRTRDTLFVSFTLRSFHLITSDLTVNLEYKDIKYDPHIKILIESLSKDSEYWKHITNFSFLSEYEIYTQGFTDPKLAKFLALLTSVKTLQIKQLDILNMILQLRQDGPNSPTFFPEMEFIETFGVTTSTLGTLLDFLDYRIELGKPIRSLTLKPQARALSINLEPLNRFTGLKIIWWGDNEYICGGKNPSTINFSAHPA